MYKLAAAHRLIITVLKGKYDTSGDKDGKEGVKSRVMSNEQFAQVGGNAVPLTFDFSHSYGMIDVHDVPYCPSYVCVYPLKKRTHT